MRLAARALMAGLLVVYCHDDAAAEAGRSRWPFGPRENAATSPPANATADTSPFANSQLSSAAAISQPSVAVPQPHEAQMPQTSSDVAADKPKWPRFHVPRLPKPRKSSTDANRNAWAQSVPPAPKPSPMQSMKNGARKVSTGTKTAWHKTVDALTPGDQSKKTAKGSQVARREVQPPLWKRMLGAKEPELQQPQTIPEWMAQKRLDP